MNQSKKASGSKHRLIVLVALAIICGLIFFLAKGLEKAGTQIPGAQNGKMAMNFKVKWIQGQEVLGQTDAESFELTDLKGKPVILNFWASWCVSCRQEARDLERTWQALKQEGVLVVGIAIQDTKADAMRFARQYGKTYMLGLDEDGKASIDYGITGVPESFFIDRDGRIVHKEAAPLTEASLLKYAAMIR